MVLTIETSRKIDFFFFGKMRRAREAQERTFAGTEQPREELSGSPHMRSQLTFLCCCRTASRLIVVVATVLCPRRSESCHYSHDEINDFCDLRCCRLMLMKYQPWDAMVVTRVRPSNVVLFHGDAMDVGWWTINWDRCWFVLSNRAHECMRWAMETKQMEINQMIANESCLKPQQRHIN